MEPTPVTIPLTDQLGPNCEMTVTRVRDSAEQIIDIEKQKVATLQTSFTSEMKCIEAKLLPEPSYRRRQDVECTVKDFGSGRYDIICIPRIDWQGDYRLQLTVCENKIETGLYVGLRKPPLAVQRPWGIATVSILNEIKVIVASKENNTILIKNFDGSQYHIINGISMEDIHGVAVDREDNIIVADTGNYRLLKISLSGKLIESTNGDLRQPIGLCINRSNDEICVTDRAEHKIVIFNSDLSFNRDFFVDLSITQHRGRRRLKLQDIAVDTDGNLYVTDYKNQQIWVYSPDGTNRRRFAQRGDNEENNLHRPTSIYIDEDDDVYVAEERSNGRCRISVFDREGVFQRSVDHCVLKRKFSEHQVNGITVDHEKAVYVTKFLSNRIQYYYDYDL